jgi:FdhD protein
VGRHNALDKLIGALARANIDPAEGAVLLTSRASYEMVDKAAMAGVRILAAISAPSALALRKAEAAGMTLVGVARRDSFVVFCGNERLGSEQA